MKNMLLFPMNEKNMVNYIPVGNYYNKYKSKNFIEQIIMRNFFKKFNLLLGNIKPKNILEIGCGEGYISKYVYDFFKGEVKIEAIDIDKNIIEQAQKTYPNIEFSVNSIYSLPTDKKYDLIILSEVLEHLDNIPEALKKVKEIFQKFVIITIPNEPIWRILNILRLKYLKDFGNTPGHIQHFNKKSIVKVLNNYFNILRIFTPMPFIEILCEVK